MDGSNGFSVDPNSLKTQASDWEGHAATMQQVFQDMQAAAMVAFPPYLFSNIAGPYNTACDNAETWCIQGLGQMSDIAAALLKAAGNYQGAEQVNTWSINEQTADGVAEALQITGQAAGLDGAAAAGQDGAAAAGQDGESGALDPGSAA